MATYSTTQEFTPSQFKRSLVVKVNGGTLSVEMPVGVDWIVDTLLTEDSTYVIENFKGNIRFVPSGGAVYEFD